MSKNSYKQIVNTHAMVEVRFYDPEYDSGDSLTYSVIAARYTGKWIFVRHCDRLTWEIPGGHIEEGESPLDAARRELEEETGAVVYSMTCVSTYSVRTDSGMGWGRLFFSEVAELGPIRDLSEIKEVLLGFEMPDHLTYPDIQPKLLDEVIRYIRG